MTAGLLVGGPVFSQDDGAKAAAKSSAATKELAQESFKKALLSVQDHKTIQAKLVETVFIGEQPIRMTGSYLGQGEQIRLELQVSLGGDSNGSLLEVSDGEILWNHTVIGDKTTVSLRNLKLIQAAIAEQPTAANWKAELGLGGLPGLMNSLEQTMRFEDIAEDREGEQPFVILKGRWRHEVAKQWRRSPDSDLPPYIPELLWIYVDPELYFPRRFLYLKRVPEKKVHRTLVRLDFQEVRLDGAVDESAFEYEPPQGIVPDDVTQQYIDQWTAREKPAENAAKPPASPTAP